MKKNAYQIPEMEVVELKMVSPVLTASIKTDDGDTTVTGAEDGSDLPDLGL